MTDYRSGHGRIQMTTDAGMSERQLDKTPTISSSSSRRGMARALFAVDNIARSHARSEHHLTRSRRAPTVDDETVTC